MWRVSQNLIFTPLVAQGAEVVGQPVACHQAAQWIMEMWAFLELFYDSQTKQKPRQFR